MDLHGSTQKRSPSMLLKIGFDKGRPVLEFPTIQDKLRELEVRYIFANLEECNLILVREFYENWDTSFGESTKVKIR
ncbi:hypothetical protein HAX54_037340, partial [Datura stramonium]|nr:hypothetical protein [Datura stramonium]